MWNFLVAGLASGCMLVLYDGSPLRDPAFLWNLVDELGITIFGTSAKYIDLLSVCALFDFSFDATLRLFFSEIISTSRES